MSTAVPATPRERPGRQPALRPLERSTSPFVRLAKEFRAERRREFEYPPGLLDLSIRRTVGFARDPLSSLLDGYERFGPIFTLRIMSVPVVFMLGPAANHFVTVSAADRFSYRDGSMGDLTTLLGDGLLTTDGEYHRRARRIMLPVFHRERIARSGELMIAEAGSAVEQLVDGERFDLYAWTRELALRIAMRALFGFESGGREERAAKEFEAGLEYFGRDYFIQMLRGPGSPFRRLERARLALDGLLDEEIARRKSANGPSSAESGDLLGLLLEARGDDGEALDDVEVRDQVMTLLFAGHDTTTSTVSFMLHELARHPDVHERLLAEQDAVLGGRPPTPADLTGERLPVLESVMEETLRLYPPAWIAPRRAVGSFEFNGVMVPGGVPVNISSWASHHLPDVWPEPRAFRPERFSAENRKLIPKGAYIPFGGGSRTCIGMRFGQMEVRAIVTLLLQRCRLEPAADYELKIKQVPTLSPRDGMPMTVRAREVTATVS